MKNLIKSLLGITIILTQVQVHAIDGEAQSTLATEKQADATLNASKINIDPQNITNTIETVVDIVETTNNFLDQIIPTDNSVGTDLQTINILSQDELKKWQYINNYFTKNLNIQNTSQKICKFVDEYAAFLSMPTTIIYIFLTDNALTGLKSIFTNTVETQASKAESPTDTATTSIPDIALNSTISLGTGSIKYITAPIIGGLLTYKILKYISAKIMKKAETCNTVLINFAKDWDLHKSQTPEVLCPLFEHLNKELTDNSGRLPQIDALLAQKIVEAIIASSSIFNSI